LSYLLYFQFLGTGTLVVGVHEAVSVYILERSAVRLLSIAQQICEHCNIEGFGSPRNTPRLTGRVKMRVCAC